MRILLLALTVSLTACATVDVPEVSRDLRDYQISEPAEIEPIPLGQAPGPTVGEIDGQPAACFGPDQLDALEEFAIAAHANTDALRHAIRALQATERELHAILIAGQAAEAQAEIYRALYVSEARYAQIIKLGSMGAAGLVLLVLTAGTL